jgi:DNA-binding GntR family transcriptional regulator
MPPKKARNPTSDARFAEVVEQLASGYKTIGQMAYGVLREAILSGALAPGEWLRQESLAEAIGVSRIPVRTALMQLESEGLVTFHPHRGARVRSLSTAQIDEIYRLRKLLESYALRLSMANMKPDRLETLRALASRLDEKSAGVDFIEARVQFYRAVYDAANNPLLTEMIEELRGHVGRYLLRFRFDGEHAHTHMQLVDHIAAGDLTSAENWLSRHLDKVQQGLLELLTEEEDAAQARVAGHPEGGAAS